MAKEGSAKDMREDRAMAKKRGMSMKQWEASAADKKHDAKKRMNVGGMAAPQAPEQATQPPGMPPARPAPQSKPAFSPKMTNEVPGRFGRDNAMSRMQGNAQRMPGRMAEGPANAMNQMGSRMADPRMGEDNMQKPTMKNGGKVKSSCGTKRMAKGGMVRGCGTAKRGIKKAKMY